MRLSPLRDSCTKQHSKVGVICSFHWLGPLVQATLGQLSHLYMFGRQRDSAAGKMPVLHIVDSGTITRNAYDPLSPTRSKHKAKSKPWESAHVAS